MPDNPHFRTVGDLDEARSLVTFEPRLPRYAAGCALESLALHVRDHKKRALAPASRSLEAHYGDFVVAQSKHAPAEARRRALSVAYGQRAESIEVAGHPGRRYPLGPEPADDDPDGRPPAVVTWHDGGMFYFVASDQFPADTLERVAHSMYGDER